MITRAKRAVKRVVFAVDRAFYTSGFRSAGGLTLPIFLGLGPGQSGSTWMFEHLSKHPDVFFPSSKELNYFDRGVHEESVRSYAALFGPGHGMTTGEITPGYSVLRRDRIAFVRKVMPDVRLILTVRDPVDRSWSAARRLMGNLGRTLDDFGDSEFYEYLRTEWAYRPKGGPTMAGDYEPGVLEGQYSKIIDNWRSHFPAEQLLVVFFDRIEKDPEGFLRTVCEHIGVRTDFRWNAEELRRRVNPNPEHELPKRFRLFLEDLYKDEIEHLHGHLRESAGR